MLSFSVSHVWESDDLISDSQSLIVKTSSFASKHLFDSSEIIFPCSFINDHFWFCNPLQSLKNNSGFGLFSYVFGVMLSVYKKKYSLTAIDTAVQGAMSVFGIMLVTGIALVAGGINLGYKFGAFLFWSLLLLIVFRLVFVLGQHMSQANKYLSFFGIILFALYVVYDTNFVRPAEVDLLLGNSSKAKEIMGWEPEHSFEDLVNMMVDYDLENE